MDKNQFQNNENRGNAKKCRVLCVYVDGRPPIYVIRLNEPLARVVIVAGCNALK
jgi:hypothetical protein